MSKHYMTLFQKMENIKKEVYLMKEYLPTWKEYCEEIGLDYEGNKHLEPYWDSSQNKLFAFLISLLV